MNRIKKTNFNLVHISVDTIPFICRHQTYFRSNLTHAHTRTARKDLQLETKKAGEGASPMSHRARRPRNNKRERERKKKKKGKRKENRPYKHKRHLANCNIRRRNQFFSKQFLSQHNSIPTEMFSNHSS